MREEEIVRMGPEQSLVGVLSRPDLPSPATPAFVMLNAGLLHRVGPGRVNVNVARALADKGFTSVRFDVSGLGDSAFRTDGRSYHESRITDAAAVMDFLESQLGVHSFVLLGICSGADHAFRVACADRRVVGAILVDAYTYPTRKAALYYYGRKLLHPRRGLSLISGKDLLWRRLVGKASGGVGEAGAPESMEFVVDTPPREEAESDILQLMAHRVALFFLYTGSTGATYTYPAQFSEMFPRVREDERLQALYWPEIDHVFSRFSHQSRFVEAVLEWAVQRWLPA